MGSITLESLAFFRRPEGQRLLAQATELAADEWQAHKVLRAHFSAVLCRAALALVRLRLAERPVVAVCAKVENLADSSSIS